MTEEPTTPPPGPRTPPPGPTTPPPGPTTPPPGHDRPAWEQPTQQQLNHTAGPPAATGDPGKPWWKKWWGIALIVVLVLAVISAMTGDPDGDEALPAVDETDQEQAADPEEAEEEVDEQPEAEEAEEVLDEATEVEEAEPEESQEEALGTRDNPLPVGTRIEMGDWTVAVTEFDLDATERVQEENSLNDPPDEGRTFVMYSVEATYEGDDSGNPWLDFRWAIVGGAGNTFGTSMDDSCGVIPDPLRDQGETYPGGSVSGNGCISVPVDQLDGATLRVEEMLSFADTAAFYAVE
jgi:hypothetical protein